MERSFRHLRAGHQDRFQHGEGGHSAGAAYLNPDVEQLGRFLLRRILISGRPAGYPGGVAQGALEVEIIHLDDHAVDLMDQLMTLRLETIQVVVDLLEVGEDLGVGADRQPQAASWS